jgi:Cellulase (glycosyl hydrolase family 5)
VPCSPHRAVLTAMRSRTIVLAALSAGCGSNAADWIMDAGSGQDSGEVSEAAPQGTNDAAADTAAVVNGSGDSGDSGDGGGGGGAEAAAEAAAETSAPLSFVHAQGTTLLDPNNQKLLLRGVNLGNWLEYEGYLWQFDGARGDRTRTIEQRVVDLIGATNAATFWATYRQTYTSEADIARIAALGFNSVRVPMTASLLLPDGQNTFDDAEFVYLQNVVTWGAAHGVYVILDMHAAPGGQTGTNIDNDVDNMPDLFVDPTNQDRLVMLWTEIAKRFKDATSVAGYDLLNEPLPEPSPYTGQLWPLYQRVAQAIRTVDPNHMLIVEGANWADDWSTLDAPFDDNMAYSFHKYWDNTDTASIQTYLDHRTMWQRPIWCGETGENDDSWYQAAFPLLESNDIGWAFWPWKKFNSSNNPYSVNLPSGYDAIQAWVGDATQPQPSAAAAQATLDALLMNIQLAGCTYNQDVVCSMAPVISKAPGCP